MLITLSIILSIIHSGQRKIDFPKMSHQTKRRDLNLHYTN